MKYTNQHKHCTFQLYSELDSESQLFGLDAESSSEWSTKITLEGTEIPGQVGNEARNEDRND
jgi:hypothetical protein